MRKVPVPSILGGVLFALMLMAAPLFAQPQGTPELVFNHPNNPNRIDWNRLPDGSGGVIRYELVRGDLTILRQSGGDFTQATDVCLADNLPETVFEDTDQPDLGQGFWYVVRAVQVFPATGDEENGTYDSLSASQQGERDSEIDDSVSSCP